MAQAALSRSKIPTKNPQLTLVREGKAGPDRSRAPRAPRTPSLFAGGIREGTRGQDRVVVEVAGGVTVYPARCAGDRWRAVWYENGRRRQCESVSEDGLAARVEKITARLAADAPGLERPGTELIAYYLSPGRHRADRPWSRKHADTQARLCARYLAPVIARLACEDIKTAHMQAAVNAAPTAGEGARLRRCISALVSAGITGGYLTSLRVKDVHWQAGDRPAPELAATVAGESALFVDPAEIPAACDVATLGRALAVLAEDYELMACFAAYTGLRWGELAALTTAQVDTAARTVTVDRKVIEVGGKLYTEHPKGRKQRRTIYPRRTPAGYPLADKLAARIQQATAEQQAGTNPAGLVFPSPKGKHWRSSNFARRVLAPAYLAARWRDTAGNGPWTWHSLRHVFCTTALFTWNIEPADVSRLAGHANIRITLDMYIGTTAGTLDRARTATQ
jgi:integrase